jgi:hypothetical protein
MHPIFPRLKIMTLTLLFVLASTLPVAADDEGWTEFSFDSSSENYKRKGERAYDLREGRYVVYEYTKTHSGDFIIMTSYRPEWVTFRAPDSVQILFSTSEENNAAVDKKAGQVSNCVPIRFGNSYVASFEGRTYTIKLVEGGYEFPAGKATFLYRAGGAPGAEHEPVMRSATKRTGRTARGDARGSESKAAERASLCENECDDAGGSGRRRPVDKRGAPEPVDGYVRFIYVCVATPSAENISVEQSDLSVDLKGPKNFRLTRQKIRPGTAPRVKFFTFPVGTYEVVAKYAGETVSDTVDLQDDCEHVELMFPGADEAGMSRAQKEPKRIDEVTVIIRIPAPRGYGSPKNHPLTLSLNAIYEGGFSTIHRDIMGIREGSVETYVFEDVRPGMYSVQITYGDKTLTDTVDISESNKEIEFVVR